MQKLLIVCGVAILVLVVAAVVFVRLKGPSILVTLLAPSPEEAYPPAPEMPSPVATTVEDLLATHEAFLKEKAPFVLAKLHPGLSDSEIDKLEDLHSIKITSDLRALYRWRNGTPRSANIDTFPNHQFVPLDVALAGRDGLRKQVKDEASELENAFAAFAGHRAGWLGLIVDGAGDGYFFDPKKSESEGSFFFCFNEDGSYIFYPAFRNYLAAVVEGEKAGVFIAGTRGVEIADYEKAPSLWWRYGASPRR